MIVTDQHIIDFYDFMAKSKSVSQVVAVKYRLFTGKPFDSNVLIRIIDRGTSLGLWEKAEVPGSIRLIYPQIRAL